MIVGTYNFRQNGEICAMVSKDSEIIDLSYTKSNSTDKYELTSTASNITTRMIHQYQTSEDVRILMPSVLSGKQQEEIIMDSMNIDPDLIETSRNPLYVCSSICKMWEQDRVRYPAINIDKNERITVYSDASKTDNGEDTAGFVLLNENNDIVMMYCTSIKETVNMSTSELIAGLMGIDMSKRIGKTDIKWISDNTNAQDSLISDMDYVNEDRVDLEFWQNYISELDRFEYKDIRGKTNLLADAICSDVRRDTFLNNELLFVSEALERQNIINNIESIRSISK